MLFGNKSLNSIFLRYVIKRSSKKAVFCSKPNFNFIITLMIFAELISKAVVSLQDNGSA